MTDPRVMRLLEDILESGLTPEEACADSPELLWEVRERWKRCLTVDAQVDAIFPPSGASSVSRRRAASDAASELPHIQGYAIESVLGRGGMGVVYKARQLKLNRPVAVKMILAGAHAGPSERARFTREAEAVASLRHGNIVQVHDVGDFDGLPYFTMEYVEGGTLAEKLAGTPQPARDAAELVATLAGAVRAAHEAGIVHRDLKPGNVLLTADGTPKITDFGLARHFGEDQTITISGTRVGTPSYMAPEQASGAASTAGPAADVYSLGAILYELLTGRPPFRAETTAATVLQVIHQEPASPSRLNAKVPRDLETVCLKCLNKDPARRYASAAALTADLRRFREGRPILARPLGWTGRLWRWARRERAAAALVATALALVGLAVGGGFWLERQKAEGRAEAARREGRTTQAVQAALEHAAALQGQGRWPDVRASLKAAQGLVGSSTPAELRDELRQARADADTVAELEDIRMWDGRRNRGAVSPSLDQLYAEAFRKYGIALATMDPADAAARVRTSPVRPTLVAFLNDWLYWSSDASRDKLRAVLDRADDDDWRRQVRDALGANDAARLKALAAAPEAPAQPPVVLSLTGIALAKRGNGGEARALLRRAQQRHPGDFWINYQLGEFWQPERPLEAVGYFRAAVAVRPGSDQAYSLLGRSLRDAGDTDGAIEAFDKAIDLNPDRAGGRDLAKVLAAKGRLEEARAVWEKILERDPPDHDTWYGYAQLCLFLDREDDYRRTCKAMLQRFGESDDWIVAERTSLASLLLPVPPGELGRAAALADRAVVAASKSPAPDNAYVRFLQGLSRYRQGRFKEAVPLLRGSAVELPNRAAPRLVLAMAQFQMGAAKEARKTLAAAVRNYNWMEAQADHPTVWVSHVFRREAEAMILPDLPAFLRGEHRPQDNDERLALLGVCQFKGLYGAAAGLYADAFAADPQLAADLTKECAARAAREEQSGNRTEALNTEPLYLAARCAALAGCGLGKDGADLDIVARARWRRQACEWLRADLAAWAAAIANGPQKSRVLANEMLTLWQVDPDLARVRDSRALEGLPAEEREQWTTLWRQVRAALREAP